jgi:excisionase family DNA binding protein
MSDITISPRRLLTIAAVQERLSVSRDTVGRLLAAGELTPVRIGRAVRVSDADLDDFITRHKND